MTVVEETVGASDCCFRIADDFRALSVPAFAQEVLSRRVSAAHYVRADQMQVRGLEERCYAS